MNNPKGSFGEPSILDVEAPWRPPIVTYYACYQEGSF